MREKVLLNGTETIELPVVKLGFKGPTIRLFNPYDMSNASKVIAQLIPYVQKYKEQGFETISVPATKPIPLAWDLALRYNMNLVVFKKEIKPYHEIYMSFNCKSITSDDDNEMFITKEDYDNLYLKKVIFFDDVLSTGATYDACKHFLKNKCCISVLKSLFVFKEGTSYKEGDEVTYLGKLPI